MKITELKGWQDKWYWKQTAYNKYYLFNTRSGQGQEFDTYKELYDFCQIYCLDAKQA